MKTKNKTKGNGYWRRLKNESLILSCLGGLSSGLISFLKLSILSFFFSGSIGADELLLKSASHESLKKFGYKKNVSQPLKTAFSRFLETSPVVAAYRRFVNRAVYTSVSSYGAFFVTFGVYIGLVYFVKLFAFKDGTESIPSLINGCIIIITAFPLLFSKKTLINFLEKSVFFRSGLKHCIPLETYNGKSKGAAVGTAFILGSIFGALSFFWEETSILAFLAATVLALTINFSPELGLCVSAVSFPFIPKLYTVVLISFTFGCYVIKVLRGKRNFHVNAGSIFVLLLLICFGFAALKGGGLNAAFAFSMTALYILAANLLTTEKLMKKCIQALCLGLGGVVLVFVFEVFWGAYRELSLWDSLFGSTSVFGDSGTLIRYCIMLLPFQFCKTEHSVLISRPLCYVLTLACIGYAVFTGHVFLAMVAAMVITVYLAVVRREIFRPLLMGVGMPVLALYLCGIPITFGGLGVYNVVSGWSNAISVSSSYPMLGVGMSQSSLNLAGLENSCNMFLQTLTECGITGFLILLFAVVFSTQRLYSSLPKKGSEDRRIAAAAGACAIAGLVFAMGYNLWQNGTQCYMLWLSLGMASAACHTRIHEKGETNDELYKQ